MKAANKQLEEWDKELTQLHERNGDLGLEVQNLREQLATERRDRNEVEPSAPIVADFPHLADVFSEFKKLRDKSRAKVADVEAVMEIIRRSLTVN